ncbi:PTS sugar transporter subunit IIA, partial [Roseomonas sp. TAS13]
MILSAERIRLDANPGSKDEAIRQAAQLLVDTGAIAPAYVESMLRREGEAETYLGDGIAIPHGQRNDRNLIHSTAISVLQVPKGVDWGEDKARLVVAIAAQGDEHIEVLRRLTEVLGDSALAERLATTRDPGLILRTLDPDAAPAATAPAMPPAGSLEASGEG